MALLLNANVNRSHESLLRAPYVDRSKERILRYFRNRDSVRYFPVIDEVETGRPKIDDMLDNRFQFNHETHMIGGRIAWLDNPNHDIEWLILLHKFYYEVGFGIAFQETGDTRYAAKWHVSEDAYNRTAIHTDDRSARVESPHLSMLFATESKDNMRLEDEFVSESYGLKHPAPIIRFHRRAAVTSFATVVAPFGETRPDVELSLIPCYAADPCCSNAESLALSVTMACDGDSIRDEIVFNHSTVMSRQCWQPDITNTGGR